MTHNSTQVSHIMTRVSTQSLQRLDPTPPDPGQRHGKTVLFCMWNISFDSWNIILTLPSLCGDALPDCTDAVCHDDVIVPSPNVLFWPTLQDPRIWRLIQFQNKAQTVWLQTNQCLLQHAQPFCTSWRCPIGASYHGSIKCWFGPWFLSLCLFLS